MLKERDLKIIYILFFLFLLDLTKPFNYIFITEFSFIGIVFLCLNYPFRFSFILSVIVGYFYDCISFKTTPPHFIEFPIILIIIRYVLLRFHAKVKKFIFSGMVIAHIIFNATFGSVFSFLYFLTFFIHSYLVFVVLSYIFKKWEKTFPLEYI